MDRSDFEIMAPVGSWESLFAAFQAKADAVYFGVGRLNMRAHSANAFTLEDLPKITDLAQEHRTKTYLTVNTVIYDEELDVMRDIVDAAKRSGVSAIIASDVAVLEYCRNIGMPVHLSTQLNISNIEAVKFYSRFADVVVLARELNLTQVKSIYEAIDRESICGPNGKNVRLEMFCHGALCMAVSGKCYMSLLTRGKSANRGECLQTCRRAYRILDKDRDIELEVDNEYILSPKDLKTIAVMPWMIDAGVRVFKIEGRARGPEYVRTVTECYNEAIDSILKGTFTEEKVEIWNQRLATVFNRGFWEGYYLGAEFPKRCDGYGNKATRTKRYVGKCVRYFSKVGVGEFLLQASGVSFGDEFLIIGPTTGSVSVKPVEIFKDDQVVSKAEKLSLVTFKVPERIRENDKLYVLQG